MKKIEFRVNVQAENEEEAKKILTALFEIKKALSTKDLLKIAELIKKKPGLINKVKAFI